MFSDVAAEERDMISYAVDFNDVNDNLANPQVNILSQVNMNLRQRSSDHHLTNCRHGYFLKRGGGVFVQKI